jgi:hypothetical protein
VGLGCTRSVAGGTWVHKECSWWDFPDDYLCDMCFKVPRLPNILCIKKMQYWVVFIAETLFFVVMQFLMVVV